MTTPSPLSGFKMALSARRSLIAWIFLLSALIRRLSRSRTLNTKARKLFLARSAVLNPSFSHPCELICSHMLSADAIKSESFGCCNTVLKAVLKGGVLFVCKLRVRQVYDYLVRVWAGTIQKSFFFLEVL